jgi:hypothetical protein
MAPWCALQSSWATSCVGAGSAQRAPAPPLRNHETVFSAVRCSPPILGSKGWVADGWWQGEGNAGQAAGRTPAERGRAAARPSSRRFIPDTYPFEPRIGGKRKEGGRYAGWPERRRGWAAVCLGASRPALTPGPPPHPEGSRYPALPRERGPGVRAGRPTRRSGVSTPVEN